MNKTIITGIGLAMALIAANAIADQCQALTKVQATEAAKLIKIDDTVFSFCVACGDKKPTPIKVTSIAVTSSQSYWELSLNGKGVDLAYTYVKTSSTRATNLAGMVGCQASDVPYFIPVK
jgi:hypothetical protein